MSTIEAIYENGVFRPRTPVDLPERTVVQFEPRAVEVEKDDSTPHQKRIYLILSERYDGDEDDIAARHNEHQP